MWDNFKDDVDFTLNPFVYGSSSSLRCFDEASPCLLEQYSICVVENYPQSNYVPWLVCMDSNDDPTQQCDSENSISDTDMETCKTNNMFAGENLIQKYLDIDHPIRGTPTVYVNGQNVQTSYSAISAALCAADSTMSGCQAAMPLGAEEEVQTFCTPEGDVVDSIVA